MKTSLFIRIGLVLFWVQSFGCSSEKAETGDSVLALLPVSLKEKLSMLKVAYTQDHFAHEDYGLAYFDAANFAALPASIRDQVVLMDEKQWAAGAYDRKTLERGDLIDLESRFEDYHDYDELTDELNRLCDLHPDLLRIETAGKSVRGRELWYVVLSDQVTVNEHEPKFIYHANMHGDEVVGRELMIYFLRHMLDQYGKDSRVTQIIDHSELFIMPSMNPDGFEMRRRANANGYDLNRNFPDRFDSPNDTPAGRQIEVQHMMNLAKTNHFVYGINWHGGEICFNLPWGNIRNRPENKYGDDAMFNPIGREYTQLNQPMYNNHYSNFDHGLTYGYEWYPVNGGINDWFNYFRRSVHSVIELSVTKWPAASELDGFWEDNREAMVTYLWRGLKGVHLEVRGENGAVVSDPTIYLSSAPNRPLKFDDGYIHRLAADGVHQVRLSAPGYQDVSLDVSATYFSGAYEQVTMPVAD